MAISQLTITKADEGGKAFAWYTTVPNELRPCHILRLAGGISYRLTVGTHADGWQAVCDAACDLWFKPNTLALQIDRAGYLIYCLNKAKQLKIKLPQHLQNILLHARITPVVQCHGDMTFANVIKEQGTGRLVFIDPGCHRGMPCTELDESKLLQSLDGFDVVYRGWPQPMAYPKMPTRPIHWALLVTHYVRLLHHVKCRKSCTFARQRIKEICACLSEKL
jgi:hypothetical protein